MKADVERDTGIAILRADIIHFLCVFNLGTLRYSPMEVIAELCHPLGSESESFFFFSPGWLGRLNVAWMTIAVICTWNRHESFTVINS